MKRKSYTVQQKKTAVRLWLYSDMSQAEVAARIGSKRAATISDWVSQFREEIEQEDERVGTQGGIFTLRS